MVLSVILAACVPVQVPSASAQDWAYADLRILDPVDAPAPNHDLIAGYARQRPGELQLRLDLLDLSPQPEFDLYLALDFLPGGTTTLPIQAATDLQWDTLLIIPAFGQIQIITPREDAYQLRPFPPTSLRVLRDPSLNALTISINYLAGSNSRQPVAIQVFLTTTGQTAVADTMESFRLDGLPPQPAQVLFAFWNAFPAYSPAQALRRWDGAHTGPQGGRHGLYNLLRVARSAQVPITLLDLNQPAALSALDYMGEMGMVKEMAAGGLLTLPQSLPGFPGKLDDSGIKTPPNWVLDQVWQDGRLAALAFGLPTSPFIFTPAGLAPYQATQAESMPAGVRGVFLPASSLNSTTQSQIPGTTAKLRWQDQVVIPIPGFGISDTPSQQATEAGLSLERRQALIDTALASQPSSGENAPILVLGGDLPASSWGNPELARLAFHYISAHPWIRVLTAQDLLSTGPTAPASPNPQPATATNRMDEEAERHQELLDDLRNAPPNPLGLAAWQTYLAAYTPAYPSPTKLPTLRSSYLGQVGVLLEAARWAEKPASIATCEADPDLDGHAECILASEEIYVVIELDLGGYLASAFSISPDGQAHQLIGPSSQIISGLSESSTWDLSHGALTDPGVIPGAFLNPLVPGQSSPAAQAEINTDRLKLTAAEAAGGNTPLRKTFRLAPGEIQVQYSGLPAGVFYATQIPLLIDPWQRFSPGWYGGYSPGDAEGISWQLTPGLTIDIKTYADSSLSAFSDSRRYLGAPEDPNRDYPTGHYLPFPLALVDLMATGDFTTTLRLIYP
jgi:hypothetical protein